MAQRKASGRLVADSSFSLGGKGLAFGLALACGFGMTVPAQAFIGDGYLQVDSIKGDSRHPTYHGWITSTAHYWKDGEQGIYNLGGQKETPGSRRNNRKRPRGTFSGPVGPNSGSDSLFMSIDKHNPSLAGLMAACHAHRVLSQVKFAENSSDVRGMREIGERPAGIPEFFEYAMSDVTVSGCPEVAGAPEQAIVLTYKNIAWANYKGQEQGLPVSLPPAKLAPLPTVGQTKTFVISWYAVANDVADNQCPVLNKMPTQDLYYRYMKPEDAAKEREQRKVTGVHYEDGEMELRGPDKINVNLLPGIVPDPGLAMPTTKVARGLNLDDNDGTGTVPKGTRRHVNYVSPDGEKGIDDQLYTIQGCIPGMQGHKGYLMQYTNEQRRNGLVSMLVQISGITDPMNDNDVTISFLYSKDHMAKSAAGTQVLADYTFRLTPEPEYAYFNQQIKGRIVNGVIEADKVPMIALNGGLDPLLQLYKAGLRFKIQPDGTLKGFVGGYQDWRKVMMLYGTSNSEFHYGFEAPGMYDAFRRMADGLPDPYTGEFHGISATYDIEGMPAFITPDDKMLPTHLAVADASANRDH